MDELAGPGGQPSAFPPTCSPGGSDPQVNVPPCCAPPTPCHRAGLCHAVLCFWGWGCFLPTGYLEREQPQGFSSASGLAGSSQQFFQAELNLWSIRLEGRDAETALPREKAGWRRGLEKAFERKNLEEKERMGQMTSWQWDLSG